MFPEMRQPFIPYKFIDFFDGVSATLTSFWSRSELSCRPRPNITITRAPKPQS